MLIEGSVTVKETAWLVLLHTVTMGTVGVPPLAVGAAMFGSFIGQAWSDPVPGRREAFTLWLANVGIGAVCPVFIPKMIGWTAYDHKTMVGALALVCAAAAHWVIPFAAEVFTDLKVAVKKKIVGWVTNKFLRTKP